MKNLMKLLSLAVLTALMAGCATLPTTDFSFSPTDVIQYDEVTFTNMSLDADSYAWDFGDGSTSTEMSPTHVFKTAGTFTVKLVATNADGETPLEKTVTVSEHVSTYMLDDTEFTIDADMFWYQSSMGGDPYIRLLTTVSGQDNPDLLKLYPNKGLGELPNTYTFDNTDYGAGTYDCGYTANYAGFNYDWTAVGKTGSGSLVIEEVDTDVYRITGDMVLSVGDYNYSTGEFVEESTSDLSLDYIGGITAL